MNLVLLFCILTISILIILNGADNRWEVLHELLAVSRRGIIAAILSELLRKKGNKHVHKGHDEERREFAHVCHHSIWGAYDESYEKLIINVRGLDQCKNQ